MVLESMEKDAANNDVPPTESDRMEVDGNPADDDDMDVDSPPSGAHGRRSPPPVPPQFFLDQAMSSISRRDGPSGGPSSASRQTTLDSFFDRRK